MSGKNLLDRLEEWESKKTDPDAADPNHLFSDSPTALAWNATIGGGDAKGPAAHTVGQAGDTEVLLDALDAIEPASLDYEEWLKVGMSLHFEGVPCDAWDSWSRRDPDRFNPGECEKKWKGFGNGAGQRVRGGTIVEMAKQRGWTRPTRTPQKAITNPEPTEPASARETAIQSPEDGTQGDKRARIEDLFPPGTLTEKDDPPLVHGLFEREDKVFITAASKAGKTWMMIRLGISMATGARWLDGFDVERGRVLYVNCELKPKKFRKRVRQICAADGIDVQGLIRSGNFRVMHLRGEGVHGMIEFMGCLLPEVRKGDFDVIIIDPFYKIFDGSEIDAKDVSNFADSLDVVCRQTGCASVYVHHHSKGKQGEKNSIDRGSGSGVFGRDADTIIDLLELERPKDAEEGLCAFKMSFVFRNNPPKETVILGVRYRKEGGCEQWIDHAGQFDEWIKTPQGKGGEKTGLDNHERAVAKRQRAASVLLWHLLENGIPTDENGEPVGFTTKQAMEIVDAYLGEGYTGNKDQTFRDFFIDNSREIVGVEFVQHKGSKVWHLVPQKPPEPPRARRAGKEPGNK